MLDKQINDALNQQINHELTAAYNYLAMSLHLSGKNLAGFANWMQLQRSEEHAHAQKLIDYVLDRGGQVVLSGIETPRSDYDSVLSVYQKALELEQLNTRTIHDLYGLALERKDYATQSFLTWFVDEQVEEEKSVEDIIALLQMAGDNAGALLTLDQRMAGRSGE